jgi:hypothetical protein
MSREMSIEVYGGVSRGGRGEGLSKITQRGEGVSTRGGRGFPKLT